MAYTFKKIEEESNPYENKIKACEPNQSSFLISGEFDLENEINLKEKVVERWIEFQLKSPISIKKDEFFGLGSKDGKDMCFSYYLIDNSNKLVEFEDKTRRSLYEYFVKPPSINCLISFSGDSSQLCYFYKLRIDFKNWSEKIHFNYPLSFQKIAPFLLFYFKKKFKLPRVLIYHIFRKF
jgi:hypothetical protein